MPSTSAIPLPNSGIVLEYKYAPPDQIIPGKNGLAVLLHPWSRLGGSLNDPTLRAMVAPLKERNYHVLRFNSRGVGHSSGNSSWTGLPEAKDLEELVRWGLNTYPDVSTLLLVGYSYGALVSSLHPVLAGIRTRHVLLSYPLSPRGALTLFRTGTYAGALSRLLRTPRADVLVVYGTRDDFTAAPKYDRWAETLKADTATGDAATLEVARVDGGTHFWPGETRERLIDILETWLDREA